MSSGKRVSLRTIAKMCGVSPATVSRIANGSGDFSEKTRTLVLETMRREGYFKTEDSMSGMPASAIAVLITDISNEYFAAMLPVITDYFTEKNLRTAIHLLGSDSRKNAALLKSLQSSGVAGIIVIGTTRLDLTDAGVPNVYLASFPLDNESRRYTVRSDEFVGGQLAAQELLRRGCKDPIVLFNRFINPDISPRLQGFLYEFESQGIKIPQEKVFMADTSKTSFDSARDMVSYLWTKGVPFDSIFACSDWRACGALVALQSIGVRVPEDVSIVGYDAIHLSRCLNPSITSVRQNVPNLARSACDMLWKLMCGEEPENPNIQIPVDLQIGRTT
ncbi:MAG: LacI family DNA-binding transcriptional regulator [Lachnospiraceae bacterium]|nr:LacI family DNA-binding transcriptional regulator [Lachnospiraceae bacterium]